MNTEKKVSVQLNKLKIENYLPTQTEIHQWSDRKKKVERILIPMVLFVLVNEEEEKKLKTYSFIYKMISYPGQSNPAVIPDEQINSLKFMLKYADSQVKFNEGKFELGGKVRIMRGPLKGFEGELYLINADKPMVGIRIECLGYACVNISKTDIVNI